MNTLRLSKLVEIGKKRLGRGHGSGRVKTSGRGTKGQNARGHVRMGFEGGQLPLTKRLPFLRGKKRNKSMVDKPTVIFVGSLNQFPKDSKIDKAFLMKHNIIESITTQVKIVGNVKLDHVYTVHIPCSKQSATAITKAGGKVIQ
ncbi:MAG: 50S ribosomal protein L15 [Microgenomates group bacterium GW2011_GWB1_40_9]|nr:MAG: 50S ribosomal protein L15 [Microgenomates group bacterium GW2011_GWC1_39_12]KKR78488.1 MAG: 50S ribosomal protein L15 [Microgenomates group bacterium GW2011_GWB1_40_9]